MIALAGPLIIIVAVLALVYRCENAMDQLATARRHIAELEMENALLKGRLK